MIDFKKSLDVLIEHHFLHRYDDLIDSDEFFTKIRNNVKLQNLAYWLSVSVSSFFDKVSHQKSCRILDKCVDVRFEFENFIVDCQIKSDEYFAQIKDSKKLLKEIKITNEDVIGNKYEVFIDKLLDDMRIIYKTNN